MNEADADKHGSDYREDRLTLLGSVAMGAGVMIGAGIFALAGQVAELAAAVVVAFSAYSYIKVCNKYPSAPSSS